MAKSGKTSASARLQSAARLSRTALAARLLQHGFYAGQDQIMLALAESDGLTPGGLARRIGVRPPTITKTINRLQGQGFVERRASESDSRQAHIWLTEAGSEAIRSIEKALRKTDRQVVKGLDKKELKQLIRLLSRIEANLLDMAPPAAEDEPEEELA